MVQKKKKKKITFNAGGNETEIDFVLVGKNNRKYVRDVKVIPGNCSTGWWLQMWIKGK